MKEIIRTEKTEISSWSIRNMDFIRLCFWGWLFIAGILALLKIYGVI